MRGWERSGRARHRAVLRASGTRSRRSVRASARLAMASRWDPPQRKKGAAAAGQRPRYGETYLA